eukprot:COSAG02_NODE_8359_length_2598_cov_13.235447_2_plen_397_part_00
MRAQRGDVIAIPHAIRTAAAFPFSAVILTILHAKQMSAFLDIGVLGTSCGAAARCRARACTDRGAPARALREQQQGRVALLPTDRAGEPHDILKTMARLKPGLELLLLCIMLSSVVTRSGATGRAGFRSGQPWRDVDGNVIDAHGAGMLLHNSTYYWYGSRRTPNASGTQMDGGIALYSSADLYEWRFESVVLPVFNCSSNDTRQRAGIIYSGSSEYPPPSCANGNGLDLERPKVVQCGGPGSGGKFVMWVRGTGYGNSPQLLAVLESDHPTGPFSFVSNRTGSNDPFHTIAPGIANLPAGYQYADATLFQDPRPPHKTFVYWRTRMTKGVDGTTTGFRAMELTNDCRNVLPSSDTQVTVTPNREGPAMFYHEQSYYLWVSWSILSPTKRKSCYPA